MTKGLRIVTLVVCNVLMVNRTLAEKNVEPSERRPEMGNAQDCAKRLFEAIVHNDPRRAADFFFPKEAFMSLKAIADPARYYDKLFTRYLEDIQTLHRTHPELAHASFDRFELSRRGGWVKPGDEGNRLPYWAARHSFIHYHVGKQKYRIEVRVLITHQGQWYVTHLSEFKK